jgi:hypothetical protein
MRASRRLQHWPMLLAAGRAQQPRAPLQQHWWMLRMMRLLTCAAMGNAGCGRRGVLPASATDAAADAEPCQAPGTNAATAVANYAAAHADPRLRSRLSLGMPQDLGWSPHHCVSSEIRGPGSGAPELVERFMRK